ncbi:hypothetical protein BCR39DRAFT_558037 [Naematelia encephala]|uniref:Uncharacterized protein n=1 Tax=Naematelia encephala TaxID=71784 RepID=A0A1Y2BAL5_9TREE|nr:hypothetical protein BCR39DRAFT_558037 [Naematelia encephala]
MTTSIITSPRTSSTQSPSQLGPPLTFRPSFTTTTRICAPSPLRESALARSPPYSPSSREYYLSPSNPFSFCRQPVFSPNRRRKVHFSPPTATHLRLHSRLVPPPPPTTYSLAWCRLKAFLEERCNWTAEEIWEAAVQAVFWMCLVIFLTCICGVGYPDKIHIDTARPPIHGHVPSRAFIKPSPAVGYQMKIHSVVGGWSDMDHGIGIGAIQEELGGRSTLGVLSQRAEGDIGMVGPLGIWEGIWEGERKVRK